MAKKEMTAEHKAKLAAGREAAGPRGEREKITHTVMSNRNNPIIIDNYTRSLAIKLFCVACLGSETNPSKCVSTTCALYPFRKSTRRAYEKDPSKESFLDEESTEEETEEEEEVENE